MNANNYLMAAMTALLLIGGGGKAEALTQIAQTSVGVHDDIDETIAPIILNVAQFNDNSGAYILDTVDITFRTQVDSLVSGNPQPTFTYGGYFQLTGLGLAPALNNSFAYVSDGIETYKVINVINTVSGIVSSPGFIGGGTIAYTVTDLFTLTLSSKGIGSGILEAGFVRLTYNYHLANQGEIPEPGTYALLGSMLGVAAVAKRRKVAKAKV